MNATYSYCSWLKNNGMFHSQDACGKGAVEVGSVIKGTGLYLSKRGGDGRTSSSVDMRTNLQKVEWSAL